MAGYSSTPLHKKLGIKAGYKVRLINQPNNYKVLIGDIAKEITYAAEKDKDINRIHFFTNSIKEFENLLPKLKNSIAKDGIIWVSWYKKSSGKPTELTETIVRDTALAIGLVDVKVCAIDDDWSGLKLVYRLKDR